MIEGKEYSNSIEDFFNFLSVDFDFTILEKKIRGNAFYDVKYQNNNLVISISYENIEDYLLVTIFILQDGNLPDYDDKTKTLHLSNLNKLVLNQVSKNDIIKNSKCFEHYKPQGELEIKLLKLAKELRLCLLNWSIIEK
ncbi:hypothetical protein GCM10009118_14360 [Wandonia haliotis]|uniref:DUF1828 domain-containing protein n=1 Tax=Wandonia haliotis TaxID=574963 RepID=A0ABN1MP01_9FLAO